MNSFNRGEWSELYGVLFLLVNPKLKLVDSNLKDLNNEIFIIKKIILDSQVKLEYVIDNNSNVLIFADSKSLKAYNKDEIDVERKKLLNKILNHTNSKGAFSIPEIEGFVNSFTNNVSFKAKSKNKSDLDTISMDLIRNTDVELNYSVKSSLGRPATILNSSSNTDFKYEVIGIDDNDMNYINAINTKTKLLDRINYIKSKNATIKFDSIPSTSFEYNLKMIDSSLPDYLANALLYSYEFNNKDLKIIFRNSNPNLSIQMADKKLGDFLNGISFGFIPGTKWDGKNTVNGGLVIVREDGQVVVLDLIYYSHFVNEFIVNESKLDSPSTTRYHMLEIFKDNGKYYFTLNLQVRYKK